MHPSFSGRRLCFEHRRDDMLDDDLERERFDPRKDADGTGRMGVSIGTPSDGNSGT